jgi:hypothetical protein
MKQIMYGCALHPPVGTPKVVVVQFTGFERPYFLLHIDAADGTRISMIYKIKGDFIILNHNNHKNLSGPPMRFDLISAVFRRRRE